MVLDLLVAGDRVVPHSDARRRRGQAARLACFVDLVVERRQPARQRPTALHLRAWTSRAAASHSPQVGHQAPDFTAIPVAA